MTKKINPVARHFEGTRKKFRAAVNAFCAHCMGCESSLQGEGHRDHVEPNFRKMICKCTATGCPLYELRPYQNIKA